MQIKVAMNLRMRPILMLLAAGVASNVHFVVDTQSMLPSSVRKDLDKRFGPWHGVTNKAENGKSCPTSIRGDFDGDGQEDFALHIVVKLAGPAPWHIDGNPTIYVSPTEPEQQRVILYLRRGTGFVSKTLFQHPPNQLDCLVLHRKGARDYRYDLGRYFRYRLDTVGVVAGMVGVSYIYERGKFNEVVTVD
jgi:hypothetical protein